MAWQQVIYLNGNVYYQGPVWEHRDASNASYRLTGTTSYVDPENSAELDPFSSNMGLENPYQFPPDPPLPHKPNIFYPGFGTGATNYCMADGIERSWSEVFRLPSLGLADQCQNNNCGPQVIRHQGRDILIPLSYDRDTGELGYHPDEWGNTIRVKKLLPKPYKHHAQRMRKLTRDEVSSLIDDIYEMFKKNADCEKGINKLLDVLRDSTGYDAGSIGQILEDFRVNGNVSVYQ
ncbi:MAG: hypothetical protein WAL47_04455 [Pyrinomonadaceae bacterium]